MNEIDDTTLNVFADIEKEIEVYNCLKTLNPSKASGPDDIGASIGSLKIMRSFCRCLLWKS